MCDIVYIATQKSPEKPEFSEENKGKPVLRLTGWRCKFVTIVKDGWPQIAPFPVKSCQG
ncbi:hypothetical protein RFM26_22905 [Mesorhizobium sp. VK23B]|uniref:Uncharacterized protein n=1 Tax=Mesorhizobium dulcispinae TaxID=3072316 RepID=A0ABU4XJF2_9HYPH|nr:hypothetical protein [Mesorhizobium sp. VK23A]MDX8468557.1 hypothetical protein [Mesorhizobium sp. VK23B]MDX8474895.1 hypothetical protein [Mesorhizobium sp. VK23A]